MARRDEGGYPPAVSDRGATTPAGPFRENPPGGRSFAVGLRWLDPYSPLRGCADLAASATAKIPRRRTPRNFQTGSKAPAGGAPVPELAVPSVVAPRRETPMSSLPKWPNSSRRSATLQREKSRSGKAPRPREWPNSRGLTPRGQPPSSPPLIVRGSRTSRRPAGPGPSLTRGSSVTGMLACEYRQIPARSRTLW